MPLEIRRSFGGEVSSGQVGRIEPLKSSAELFALTHRALMFLEVAGERFVFKAAVAAADFPRHVTHSARIGPRDQDLTARILIAFHKYQSRHRAALSTGSA
jgi:hypothetical protein